MTRTTKLTWTALGGILLSAGMIMPMAHAQSADALLDKLVEKGVLSVREANELREQADEGFNKAFQAKTGMPDWVSQLKLYGDVRGRYEFFRTDNDTPGESAPNKNRDRLRYRLRVGATVTMMDNFEAGFRFTSSEPNGNFGGDPISGNTTFQDNGSKKFLYVDMAYGKWTPVKSGPWLLSGTIGKMENPFVVSDMVFDADYTPEGVALQGGYTFNDCHSLKWNVGYFVLDEINQGAGASDDPSMIGGQLRWDAKWTPELSSSIGAAWLIISEKESLGNAAIPNVNVGNTRNAAGFPTEDFAPIVVDAAVTYNLEKGPLYAGPFPIRVAGEFMHNPRADMNENGWWAGAFVGKSGKKGTWEASYRYKRLEQDAWFEEFVDSDFGAYYTVAQPNSGLGNGYRAGTGIKGHIIKVAYSPSDSFTIGATWFWTSLIDEPSRASLSEGVDPESGQHRVQIDAVWKF
jgi:hypothetical protein